MGLQDRDYYPELSDDESWRGPKAKKPIAITTILICLCVAVSIADLVTSNTIRRDGQEVAVHPLMEFLSLSANPRDLIWKPYTLLTYGFAHSPLNGSGGNATHLIFNMLGLYFIGNFCEAFLGRKEFLWFYLASIIFAGAVYLTITVATGSTSGVVGASGAISALVILAAWKFPKERVLLMGVADVPMWGLGVGFVAMDVFGTFLRKESGTAYTCHLGGALFATLYYNLGMSFEFLNFQRWGTWRRQAATRRNLKVHADDEEERKASELVSLASQADQLLAKIQEQGQSSLTKRERDLLERYSREVQHKRGRRD